MSLCDVVFECIDAKDIRGLRKLLNESALMASDLVTCRDEIGSTPLHVAAMQKDATVAEFLVRLGADCRAKDAEGRQPLHVAAYHNSLSVAQLLVAAGTPLEEEDVYNYRPLDLCPPPSDTDMIDKQAFVGAFLIECGAEYDAFDVLRLHLWQRLLQLCDTDPDAISHVRGPRRLHMLENWAAVINAEAVMASSEFQGGEGRLLQQKQDVAHRRIEETKVFLAAVRRSESEQHVSKSILKDLADHNAVELLRVLAEMNAMLSPENRDPSSGPTATTVRSGARYSEEIEGLLSQFGCRSE